MACATAFRDAAAHSRTCLTNGQPPIYAGVIDNPQFNAVATRFGGINLVGIYWGGVVVLVDTFARLLSHPHVLPSIGDVNLECVKDCHTEGIYADSLSMGKSRSKTGLVRITMPLDWRRRGACAMLMWRMAIRFLMHHELGHIMLGHVGCAKSNGGQALLQERFANTSKFRGKSIAQVFELEADEYAVSSAIRSWLPELTRSSTTGNMLRAVCSNQLDVLYLWLFTIEAVVRIWGLDADLDAAVKLSHPPTAVRLRIIVKYARLLMSREYPQYSDNVLLTAQRAANDCTHALRAIGHEESEEISYLYTQSCNDPRFIEYIYDLFDKRISLLPSLEPLRYVKLDIHTVRVDYEAD